MLRVGWFSTGRGPGSRDLLRTVIERKLDGTLDIDVSFVFCNWDNTEEDNPRREQRELFFDLVRGFGIPLITLSWKNFQPGLREEDEAAWRLEYGREMRRRIDDRLFDVGMLAGYMLWMDDETCRDYRLLNLHPALPDGPKGTWQEVIWKLIEERADEQGSMIHVCTEEWDRGPALSYCRFSLREGDYPRLWGELEAKVSDDGLEAVRQEEGVDEPLFQRIRRDGARRELPLIVHTLKSIADGRLDPETLDGPMDLSYKIDEELDKEVI